MLNPTGLCQCGCGRPAPIATQSDRRAGWIKGEPKRFIHGHSGSSPKRTGIHPVDYAIESRGYTTPCWIWQKCIHKVKGYGHVGMNGKLYMAHRVAYEQFVGPIPVGLELDHLCRVRACINPAHLEPVTHAENIQRGGRAVRTHCEHGHEYTPENTQWRSDSTGRRCRECQRLRTKRRAHLRQSQRQIIDGVAGEIREENA